MDTVGFIGLGIMGFPMATRLIKAGYRLTVFDLNRQPMAMLEGLGAQPSASPKDASADAGVVISMLPSPAVTREAVMGNDGVFQGLQPGSLYIDMSTSDPALTRELHGALSKKGAGMIDAPVSGGKQGAAEGTLTIMVGGEPQDVERARPILSCLGKKVVHVGSIASGHIIKIINNMLYSVTLAAASEAMALGTKAGVDPVMLREVMNSSSARSYPLDVKMRNCVFPRNFEPGFTVNLQAKDLDLALTLAKDTGAPVLMASLVRQAYQALTAKGYGDKDTAIIVTFFEELMRSGEIRGEMSCT